MNYKHTNWLFDVVMPQVKGNAFKIICFVARQTWGWNKNSDMISISQFMTALGSNSRAGVTDAVESAIESGFISRAQNGQSYVYRMNYYEEPYQKAVQLYEEPYQKMTLGTVPENGTTVPENGTEPYQKMDTQREKELIKIFGLAKIFENLTGFFMPTDTDTETNQENWVKPLQAIDNQGKGKERIEYAVNVMREKGYTIKTPKSLMTFALNWNGSANMITKSSDGGMYV